MKITNNLNFKLMVTKKILKSKMPILTIGATKKIAATNIEWHSVLSELIDNSILNDRSRCVNVLINLHYDSDNSKSYIEVIDDSIGIPESDILNVFDYGTSSNQGKMLLCKMGMGLKSAVWGLGELEYLISKTENGNKCQVEPAKYNGDNDELSYVQLTPTTSQLDSQNSGTIVRIKNVNEKLPDWASEKYFNIFIDKLNSMYAHLLNENRVKITIAYTSSKGHRWTSQCFGSFPLMSNPRHILNNDISIGFNEPTYKANTSETIKDVIIQTTNTKVKLTAWHKPHPIQVEKYFDLTKDPKYDSDRYKNSVFSYGSDTAGITIMYKGKYLEFGLEKHLSRAENQGIIVEIDDDSGLSFTAFKNTLQKNNNYREMLEAVNAFLHENGFFVRATAGTPNVAEEEIVNKFLDFVKTDSFYKEGLGIIDFDKQVQTWIRTEVGETDVIIKDYNDPTKVTNVIEAKKDRCGGYEAAQLWGYMAYHNCKKGILLTGVDEQPSFSAMINSLKSFTNLSEVEISGLNVKTFKAGKFFNI